MEYISIRIQNIKSIKNFLINLKVEKGICVLAGENGSGKSTILSCIGQLINERCLNKELTASYPDGRITYKIGEKEWVLEQNSKKEWVSKKKAEEFHLIQESFFEASLVNGTRFNQLGMKKQTFNFKMKHYNSSDFIKNNLIEIIGEESREFLSKLKYAKDETNRIYYIEHNGQKIKEFNFSMGEYFLLSILKILDGIRRKEDKLKMIIIDEIDIALHPFAQIKLLEKMERWKDEFNIMFIVSTHSIPLILKTKEKNLYYIRRGAESAEKRTSLQIVSEIYDFISYEKIIFVEDRLSKQYIQCAIKKNDNLSKVAEERNFCIIPIGGYREVLKHALDSYTDNYYSKADIICVLDGDVKDMKDFGQYNWDQNSKIILLPIVNVEFEAVEMIKKGKTKIGFSKVELERLKKEIDECQDLKKQFSKILNSGRSEEEIISHIYKEDNNFIQKMFSFFNRTNFDRRKDAKEIEKAVKYMENYQMIENQKIKDAEN